MLGSFGARGAGGRRSNERKRKKKREKQRKRRKGKKDKKDEDRRGPDLSPSLSTSSIIDWAVRAVTRMASKHGTVRAAAVSFLRVHFAAQMAAIREFGGGAGV